MSPPYGDYNCSYCQTILKSHHVEIRIEYEIPINPPPGARDLSLKKTEKIKDDYYYYSCPKCNAKYRYATWCLGSIESVEEIPSKDTLLKKFIENHLPRSARILRIEAECYISNPDYKNRQNKDCFIATSVYGSSDTLEVWILRKFRDECLFKSFFGKIFISFYYSFSPPLVKYLENKKKIKFFIKKIILDPLVTFISNINK